MRFNNNCGDLVWKWGVAIEVREAFTSSRSAIYV